ncbi:class I SAM-dependent methyltransferase [Bacteroidales bacterium OttesenSCG-928-B11]|nr:class I SAM-dependent methyltransferase [Bacteroidales bacterium OttesenSCG-928-B11]MDL2326373.1 class I SAM-dependent methyltransferase [Bacteroidales bacterium OttesenSCG-928-A14]
MDIYGKGLTAYFNGKYEAAFVVESDVAEQEIWPIEVFFRNYAQMPALEQEALRLCKGRVLDIGAGAGSHALYLQEQGLDTTALDISPCATNVMRKRGVREVIESDFFTYAEGQFDTLLLLMNGIGIAGKLERLPEFFQQCRKLLKPNGQILLDSSDILYLFAEEDGSVMIDLNADYYGEINYQYCFLNECGDFFPWLFVDFDTLSSFAEENGFKCEMVMEDDHFQYLARITPQ